jgi:hypothetical protein
MSGHQAQRRIGILAAPCFLMQPCLLPSGNRASRGTNGMLAGSWMPLQRILVCVCTCGEISMNHHAAPRIRTDRCS